ncbi:MAG TPA: hypothetical protein VH855_20365 [Acetobacteraceae bacterium]|jgi:hypothetical protein
MMRGIIKIGLTLAAVVAVSFGPRLAQAAEDVAALAKALPDATVSLEQGLRASEREGKPISGKFELEDGALQLSVYTAKAGKFSEVIVDHKSAAIKKAEPITNAEDLKDAKEQEQAMNAAKASLSTATAQAVRENAGYRAVSVIPAVRSGHPVAEVRLTNGTTIKAIEQKLD